MADGDVSFTVRLINQVTGPAKLAQASMKAMGKTFTETQQKLNAPTAKRGALSDWDKMVSGAKRSQAADMARQNARLVQSQKRASAHHEKASAGMSQFHADHSMAAGALSMGADAMVGATFALVAAAGAAAVAVGYLGLKFVEAGLEAAAFAQGSIKAIGYLTDNALHAGQVFNDVRHLAQGLGLDVQDTMGSFQKLLAAQFTVGESKGLIRMGADLQAIGAKADDVKGVLLAISQIKSKGRLQGDEMMQLQERGVSAALVYKFLGKRMHKSTAELMKLQQKGKIGSDDAIGAIQEAVMYKTHESGLGKTGADFANNTLQGMSGQLKAGMENFWVDVGVKMLPGATRVAKLIAGTIGKISNDPQIAKLGEFMLAKFEKFTNWVQANWPAVETLVVGGLHLMSDAIMWVVDAFTLTETKWTVIKDLAIGLAIGFGVLAIAGFLLLAPLYLAIAAVGLLIAAFGMAVAWIVDQAVKWYEGGQNMMKGLISGVLSMLGPLGSAMGLVASIAVTPGGKPGAPAIAPGNSGAVISAIQGVEADKTEGGHAPGAAPVIIHALNVTTPATDDPQKAARDTGAAVRAELQKLLHPG